MSNHWRLALRHAAWVLVGGVVVAGVMWALYGADHALALGYGVGIGLVSFVSTALTVSLLTGSSTAGGVAIGAASFFLRFAFAVGALGVPAYLEVWPAVPMLAGFAGVYLAENVTLLPKVLRIKRDAAGEPRRDGAERRVKV